MDQNDSLFQDHYDGKDLDLSQNNSDNDEKNSVFLNIDNSVSDLDRKEMSIFGEEDNDQIPNNFTELAEIISSIFPLISDHKIIENKLNSYIKSKLNIYEICNTLFTDNQIELHLDYFKFHKDKKERDFSNCFIFVELEKYKHLEIIDEYKTIHIDKYSTSQSKDYYFHNVYDKRRKLLIDKQKYFNYICIDCTNGENCNDDCFYSHNQFEVNFHYLKYKTKYCKVRSCKNDLCPSAHEENDFRILFDKEKPKIKELIKKLQDLKIFDATEEMNKLIRILPSEFNVNTYKVAKCPYEKYCQISNLLLCLNYHSWKDRKRENVNLLRNEPCNFCYIDKKYNNPKNKCPKKDKCLYFHSKVEESYHYLNFRKKKCVLGLNCSLIVICPYTHPNNGDHNYSTSVVSHFSKHLELVKNKYNQMAKEIKNTIKKFNCFNCKELLNAYYVLKCGHFNCSNCYETQNACNCGSKKKKEDIFVRLYEK